MASPQTPAAAARVAYPIGVSGSGRYLVDQGGKPFLYHADTAWRMPQRLSLEQANWYLDQRAVRGYNAIHLHAINKELEGPLNVYGQYPFAAPDDLSRPNEQYWQHLDALLALVFEHGMLAVVSAAWLGAGGQGWRPQLSANAAYGYGCFLGRRYAHLPNIVWILGGDNDPGDRAAATAALACGLRETAPLHLLSYHAAAEHASAMFFHDAAWLDINLAYTYRQAYQQLLAELDRPAPVRPLILGETGYLNEANTGFEWDAKLLRQQMYWALLSGACGQARGSRPVWRFAPGWQAALDEASDRQMGYVLDLFAPLPWHTLLPDRQHAVLLHRYEQGATWAAAAYGEALALIYLPTRRSIEVNMQALGGAARARWYDPTDGSFRPA